MNRRNFLILSATTLSAASVAAAGGTLLFEDDQHDYLTELLHLHVGEFVMDSEHQHRFLEAFSDYYGPEKVLAFVGLHRIRAASHLSTDYTNAKVDLYVRRLVSDFMTSTDFFRNYQTNPVPTVNFTGFKLPCSNPFAQRA